MLKEHTCKFKKANIFLKTNTLRKVSIFDILRSENLGETEQEKIHA